MVVWRPYLIKEQIRISEMFSIFEIHHPYGYHFLGETHNFWECVYVLEGDLCVTANERVYKLSEGEIIFHKPMELHKFHVDNKAGAKVFIFTFSAQGELTGFLQEKVFELTPSQKECVYELLQYLRDNSPPDGDIPVTHRFLWNFESDPLYSHTVASNITQLILSFAQNTSKSSVSSDLDAKMYQKAVNYMNKNVFDNLSVSDIAEFCNVSVSSVKRIFFKYGGLPIHRYFLKLKMQKATELLQSGVSVSETAELLNFCSQAYFSKAYKREMGVSPSELKK